MRTSKWTWAVLAASALALSACGDDTGGGGGSDGTGGSSGEGGHDGEGGHGATQSSTSSSSTSSATSSSSSTGGGDAAPAAPVLDEVMAMHGALHLYWTNIADDCDEVEGERMTADEEFAVFFTVPGTVDNEADDEATDPATEYTYRLRCRRGETYSDYSNELTASPE
jgi:hypothetical protein